MKALLTLLMGGLVLAAPLGARAQQTLNVLEKGQELVGKFEIDTAIPDAPGFSAIGLQPTEVVDPGIGRIRFVDVVNFFDDHGNLKPGFAIGGTPYWWFNSHTRLDEYRGDDKRLLRILARTEVSAGFADGGEDKPDRVGLGFRTDLLSDRDYRLDTERYDCFRATLMPGAEQDRFIAGRLAAYNQQGEREKFEAQAQAQALANGTALSVSDLDDKTNELIADQAMQDLNAHKETVYNETIYNARDNAGVKRCDEEAAERMERKSSWIVAGGLALRLDEAGGKDVESDGGAVWTAFRKPMGDGGSFPDHVSFFGRYDFDKMADGDPAGPIEYRSGVLAVSAGAESEKAKFALQVGYQTLDYAASSVLSDDSYFTASLAYARKLEDDLWIEVKAGRSGKADLPDTEDDYLVVQFKWAKAP